MRSRPVRAASAVVAALALVACGRSPEVQPVDGGTDARISDLERQVKEWRQKYADAGAGASVGANEAQDLRRSVAELQAQVKALDAAVRAVAAASSGGGAPAGAPAPVIPPLPTAPGAGLSIDPQSDGSFSEQQLTSMRRLLDEVEKRRQAEQQADRVKRELTRAGVSLTSDQEAAIIRLQNQASERMRELFRNGMGGTDAERQNIQQQRDAIRQQFESEVRAVIPAADADKVVDALRRGLPGFFPRREGMRMPGGMSTQGE